MNQPTIAFIRRTTRGPQSLHTGGVASRAGRPKDAGRCRAGRRGARSDVGALPRSRTRRHRLPRDGEDVAAQERARGRSRGGLEAIGVNARDRPALRERLTTLKLELGAGPATAGIELDMTPRDAVIHGAASAAAIGGDEVQRADVAAGVGVSSNGLSVPRRGLIDKGIIEAVAHGMLRFTVPGFGGVRP